MLARRLLSSGAPLMSFWLTSLAGCSVDKAGGEAGATQGATTSGDAASTAVSTGGESSSVTLGTTGSGTTGSGTTDGAWPPVQCGDSVCAEGDVCVVDQTWFCCAYHAAASTTGGSGTSSGGDSTFGEATTGEPCRDYLAYSYTCEPVPPKCQSNPSSLEDCLLGRYCPERLNPDSFHDGLVDCGPPNHGCYP